MRSKKVIETKQVEFRINDVVLYQDDISDKKGEFKIVEILDKGLHIKMIDKPYSSYLVPVESVTKV